MDEHSTRADRSRSDPADVPADHREARQRQTASVLGALVETQRLIAATARSARDTGVVTTDPDAADARH